MNIFHQEFIPSTINKNFDISMMLDNPKKYIHFSNKLVEKHVLQI